MNSSNKNPALHGTLIGHTIRPPRRPVHHGALVVQNLMLTQGLGYKEATAQMRALARTNKFIVIE